MCIAYFRDTFLYASSCHVSGLDPVLGAIAEACFRPKLSDNEVQLSPKLLNKDEAIGMVQFDSV